MSSGPHRGRSAVAIGVLVGVGCWDSRPPSFSDLQCLNRSMGFSFFHRSLLPQKRPGRVVQKQTPPNRSVAGNLTSQVVQLSSSPPPKTKPPTGTRKRTADAPNFPPTAPTSFAATAVFPFRPPIGCQNRIDSADRSQQPRLPLNAIMVALWRPEVGLFVDRRTARRVAVST